MELDDLAEQFGQQTGKDFDDVLQRWNKKPENIVEDLFRVRDVDTRQARPLKLFSPYQPQALHAYFFGDSSKINVYKGRRIGATFIFLIAITLDAISHPKTFYPIVCPSEEASKSRLEDIYDILDMCVLNVETPTDNSKKCVFGNGSRIEAFTGGSDSARGDDPARAVLIDEMAFVEDQEDMQRAFNAFIALGDNNKMIQVSTPKVNNDLFMRTHRRGSPTGFDEDGNSIPITIKQPSFKDPDSIDIHTSLFEQDATPVRPDMNLSVVEDERASDPAGFAQEYLCSPVDNSYRFFNEEEISAAQERGSGSDYVCGPVAEAQYGGMMVMSADLAFGGADDTVITIWEHRGGARRGNRYLRHWEVVTEDTIRAAGEPDPSKTNPNHVATRIAHLFRRMDCEHVVYDETGGGQGFKDILREKIGRGVHPFNFSDKESMNQMMHDFNYALSNNNVTLVPDNDIHDQLAAIIKIQEEDYNNPRYSGKDQSPSGKDDIAISLVLGAYPSMLADGKSNKLQEVDDQPTTQAEGEQHRTLVNAANQRTQGNQRNQPNSVQKYGVAGVERTDNYDRRHPRPVNSHERRRH
jgi:hypothetical protein